MEHDQKSQQHDIEAFTPDQVALGSPARTGAQAPAAPANEGDDSADMEAMSTAEALNGGAPPTNRAPLKYNPEKDGPCRNLRTSIDSLYLSYQGKLAQQADDRLTDLKKLAQSDNEWERAAAQWLIGDHLFAVLDKAPRPYRYVLKDERFHIQLSKGDKVPLAYVQVSSQYLTAIGAIQAENDLRFVVNSLGLVKDEATISRVDLCVDFVPYLDIDQFDVKQWVTRTRLKERYWDGDRATGWKIGKGGPVQCRLYDKILEITRRSHKDYMLAVWKANGWHEGEPVWRLEFQFNRTFLNQARINTLAELLERITGLWLYACEDWLRLCILQFGDDNRSRWPSHPFWNAMSCAEWQYASCPAIVRVRSSGLPSDQQLFTVPLGYVASFMAREGITDWDEGLGAYLAEASAYHQNSTSGSMALYVQRKTRLKGREFSTINNRIHHPADQMAEIHGAEAYRSARDGEDE